MTIWDFPAQHPVAAFFLLIGIAIIVGEAVKPFCKSCKCSKKDDDAEMD